MKRLVRWFLRVAALALAIALAAALFPYARDWLGSLLPQGKYERTSTLLAHEMEKAGELTAVRHMDTGRMSTRTDALIIGTVQQVTVPYAYEIGLGFSLSDVRLTPDEAGITVQVPPVRVLYDSFQVTGDPEVKDFWYRLTEAQYQKMLNDQAAACRAGYESSTEFMEEAWDAACEALEKLFSQWSGEHLPLRFIHAAEGE